MFVDLICPTIFHKCITLFHSKLTHILCEHTCDILYSNAILAMVAIIVRMCVYMCRVCYCYRCCYCRNCIIVACCRFLVLFHRAQFPGIVRKYMLFFYTFDQSTDVLFMVVCRNTCLLQWYVTFVHLWTKASQHNCSTKTAGSMYWFHTFNDKI